MSWRFLHVQRRSFAGADNWGYLHVMTAGGAWERLCYSYELAWIPGEEGASKRRISRIAIGEHELEVRSDEPRGWRLELRDESHGRRVQVQHAHKSLYIAGCILPVHLQDFAPGGPRIGQHEIQARSMELMGTIKSRYEALKKGKTGFPTLLVSAFLPPEEDDNTRTA